MSAICVPSHTPHWTSAGRILGWALVLVPVIMWALVLNRIEFEDSNLHDFQVHFLPHGLWYITFGVTVLFRGHFKWLASIPFALACILSFLGHWTEPFSGSFRHDTSVREVLRSGKLIWVSDRVDRTYSQSLEFERAILPGLIKTSPVLLPIGTYSTNMQISTRQTGPDEVEVLVDHGNGIVAGRGRINFPECK